MLATYLAKRFFFKWKYKNLFDFFLTGRCPSPPRGKGFSGCEGQRVLHAPARGGEKKEPRRGPGKKMKFFFFKNVSIFVEKKIQFFFSKVLKFTWKMRIRLNWKKNYILDFGDFYFSSYGHFGTFLYLNHPNFQWIFTITRKIEIWKILN